MTALRLIAFALVLLIGDVVAVRAQSLPAPPPGMTQEQFDAVVDALAKALVVKLKNEGPLPAPAPAATPPQPASAGNVVVDDLAAFLDKTGHVLQAVPTLGSYLAALPGLVDESPRGGSGPLRLLLALAVLVGIALVAEAVLRRSLGHLRRRLAAGVAPERGLASLINLGLIAVLDGLGVLAVWLIFTGALVLFAGNAIQDKVAAEVLTNIFYWRFLSLVFRILLQPDLPPARLCHVDDEEARKAYHSVSAVIFLIIVGVILTNTLAVISTPLDAIAASRLLAAPVYLAALLWLVVRSAAAARQWFGGLSGVPQAWRWIGSHWVAVMVPFVLVLEAALIYGAVSGLAKVALALRLTLGLAAGLLIFETLLLALLQRVDSWLPGRTPASDLPKLPDVLARCLRVAVLIGVGVALSKAWVVHVLGLVDASEWANLTLEMRTAGLTVFAAFVLWEILKFVTDPYTAQNSRKGDGGGPTAFLRASRLATLVPLLRVTLEIVLALVAGLIVLADLGVNITPLLAGASILGLAVSFGSQALVKDIVSGIFYLADDAFRAGEYIECGQTKGVVEGFTLRSIRIRHPNGQLHTVPFGDLGQIANFSRDWAIVKYDFSFPRDTDIEKVRHAVAGLDGELQKDPDQKHQILEPLKMQGVVGVTDSTLVIEFRFATQPGNPEAIRRTVMSRMMRAFQDQGIAFGSATAAS